MLKSKFLGTVLVIVLGVNVGAWALSVATSPSSPGISVTVPVTPPALQAQSLSASVGSSQAAFPEMTATTTSQ